MVYVSTQTFQTSMRSPVMQAESQLSNVQQEISTGVYADLGLQLGGQTSYAISLAQQSNQITAITASNVTTSTRLSTTDAALTNMMSDAQKLANNLLGDAPSTGVLQSFLPAAQSALDNLVGQLNTSVGGQYIFGGTNTNQVPLTTSSAIQAAASTALASDVSNSSGSLGTTLSDPSSATATLFQGSGWSTLSNASSSALTSQISPNQTITSSVSANQTAFQQIAQAYALITAGASQNLTQAQAQDVATQAESLLTSGIAGLTQIQAGVGVSQNSVTSANTAMTAQQTILTKNVSNMEEVDTYSLSNTVTSLQTQLQDSFSVTSQLSKLSLVNYISG